MFTLTPYLNTLQFSCSGLWQCSFPKCQDLFELILNNLCKKRYQNHIGMRRWKHNRSKVYKLPNWNGLLGNLSSMGNDLLLYVLILCVLYHLYCGPHQTSIPLTPCPDVRRMLPDVYRSSNTRMSGICRCLNPTVGSVKLGNTASN